MGTHVRHGRPSGRREPEAASADEEATTERGQRPGFGWRTRSRSLHSSGKERHSHRDPMNVTKLVLTNFKRFTELTVDLASNAPLSGSPPKEPPAARPVEARREGAAV